MKTFITNSGIALDPADIQPSDIRTSDIAHALARLCRFSGHCSEFYSVAQHSVYISYYVPQQYALEALMHDATEAYLGDMTRPVKSLLPEYSFLEDKVWDVIAAHYNLPKEPSEIVKEYDLRILINEIIYLFPPNSVKKIIPNPPMPIEKLQINPWSPKQAEELWLHRYNALTAED